MNRRRSAGQCQAPDTDSEKATVHAAVAKEDMVLAQAAVSTVPSEAEKQLVVARLTLETDLENTMLDSDLNRGRPNNAGTEGGSGVSLSRYSLAGQESTIPAQGFGIQPTKRPFMTASLCEVRSSINLDIIKGYVTEFIRD